MNDIETQARELLRLDAEATPGPWGVTHRLRVCAVDERGEPRPRTGMQPTGDPFPNVGASGLPSAGEAVFAPARDYATDEVNVTLIVAARNTAPALARAYLAVCKVLEDNGCDCDCDHCPEDHDDDCVRCLGCRVELAMRRASIGNAVPPKAAEAIATTALGCLVASDSGAVTLSCDPVWVGPERRAMYATAAEAFGVGR